MALTPERIQELRAKAGIPAQGLGMGGGTPGQEPMGAEGRIAMLRKNAGLRTEAAAADETATKMNTKMGIAKETVKNIGKTLIDSPVQVGKTLGQAAAAKNVQKNLTEGDIGVKDMAIKVLRQISNNKKAGKDTTRLEKAYNEIAGHSQESDMSEILPTLNKSNFQAVMDTLGVGLDVITAGAGKPAAEAAKVAGKKTAEVAVKAATKAAKIPAERAAAQAEKAVQRTVEAVNPELSGKKLATAYKEIVTGQRTAKESGILSKQELSPAQRAIEQGQRLHEAGIALKNKPVPDLNTLKGALTQTEEKLTTLLKGDPEVVYNADKPTLITKLSDLKGASPREFNAIKDSKAVYDNVIDFAQHVVDKSDDTIEGLRTARSVFDTQARKEYPSAFKDGAIDVKTPAGRAIKAARDMMNDHLYETAPEGSEIKALIQREADILQAAENISAKAAKGEAKTKIAKALETFREHPVATAVGGLSALYGGFKFLTGH